VCPCGRLAVGRVSVPRLAALADEMPLRERQIVETVARLSLVSGRQLSDLFFSSFSVSVDAASRARLIRRALERLVATRALERLKRRQGGARGGSGSWVYALGPAGRRLIAYWAGEGLPRSRTTHEPGALWTAHTLAVSDLYVRLREAEDAGRVELLTFDAEPACWRMYTRLGGAAATLKPDAHLRLGAGEFEDSFLIEVDLGTERRGQLTRQHRAYREYFRAGVEQTKTGVFPLVLWVVPDTRRATLLKDIQRGLGEPALFAVATAEQALAVLCDQTPATTTEGTT
jgi:Replication-relaxation